MRKRILMAAAVAGGLLTAVPAGAAYAGTAATGVCVTSHGKYGGQIIRTFRIEGRDEQTTGVHGGTVQAWFSPRCGTAWTRTWKIEKYSVNPLYTVAVVQTYDKKQHTWNTRVRREATTRNAVETPAVAAPRHGRLHVEGGFLGDYQFDSAHSFRY